MITYRKLKKSDSEEIAKIHLKAFPNFFLTTLGYSFLNTYYQTCVVQKDVIGFCAVEKSTNKIIGFSIGCLHSKNFNINLVISNLRLYCNQFFILLFKDPSSILRLIKNLNKANNSFDDRNYSELLSIAVLPKKKKLGIGKNLLNSFEEQVFKRGGKIITLTTDSKSNEKVIKFYNDSGYKLYYNFISYPKREMLRMIKLKQI